MLRKLIFMLAVLAICMPVIAEKSLPDAGKAAATDRDVIDFYVAVSRLSANAFEVSQQYAYESGKIRQSEKETEKTKAQLAELYGQTLEAARRLGVLDQLKSLRASELVLLTDGVPRAQEMRYRWEARMQALKTKHESAIGALEAELESK